MTTRDSRAEAVLEVLPDDVVRLRGRAHAEYVAVENPVEYKKKREQKKENKNKNQ